MLVSMYPSCLTANLSKVPLLLVYPNFILHLKSWVNILWLSSLFFLGPTYILRDKSKCFVWMFYFYMVCLLESTVSRAQCWNCIMENCLFSSTGDDFWLTDPSVFCRWQLFLSNIYFAMECFNNYLYISFMFLGCDGVVN